MTKNVSFSSDGRKSLTKGVNIIGDAVKVTLGAKGRNVIIENEYAPPHITKDGVTVAKSITLEDPIENMGAALIKEVASKTVDLAGDGTTTATLLAQSMINLGIKAVESGANPMDLKIGINNTTKNVIKIIKSLSKEVSDDETLKNIATISANNDTAIGQLISEAVSKVGRDGLITVEESTTQDTFIEIVEGMKIDRGYISPLFCTDNIKMVAELINPYVLLYDRKISSIKEIIGILEKVSESNKPLLIIAEDVDGEALATLVVNKLRGNINVCAIKSPDFGQNRNLVMEDIATLVGGVFVSEEKGIKLEDIGLNELGLVDKISISKDSCIVVSGLTENKDVDDRCTQIKEQLKTAENTYEKDKLKSRLAKLKSGVAVVKVGGFTETEIKEKKDRIDDALCATRSAVEEGFVAGGGITYLHCISLIDTIYNNDDEILGGNIVKKSLQEPFRQILKNGGIEPSEYISIISKSEYGTGYNIKTDCVENLFTTGVIDPSKVLRVALENASSIASIFLTTECVVSKKQKTENNEDKTIRR